METIGRVSEAHLCLVTVTHVPADQRKAGQAIKHLNTASLRLSKSALDKAIARLQGKFARKRGHALTPETARKGGLARSRTPKQQKFYAARLGLNVQELDSFVRFLHLRSDSDGSCCQQLPVASWQDCERSVVQEFHFCNVERQLDAGNRWVCQQLEGASTQVAVATCVVWAFLPKSLSMKIALCSV